MEMKNEKKVENGLNSAFPKRVDSVRTRAFSRVVGSLWLEVELPEAETQLLPLV